MDRVAVEYRNTLLVLLHVNDLVLPLECATHFIFSLQIIEKCKLNIDLFLNMVYL